MFGIQDEKIKQKLLDSKDLMFQTAREIAESFAKVSMKLLHVREETTVNQVHNMKMEKPKLREFAHTSKHKEEKFASDRPCYRYSTYHNPKFWIN